MRGNHFSPNPEEVAVEVPTLQVQLSQEVKVNLKIRVNLRVKVKVNLKVRVSVKVKARTMIKARTQVLDNHRSVGRSGIYGSHTGLCCGHRYSHGNFQVGDAAHPRVHVEYSYPLRRANGGAWNVLSWGISRHQKRRCFGPTTNKAISTHIQPLNTRHTDVSLLSQYRWKKYSYGR
jgi:hypothetical protein